MYTLTLNKKQAEIVMQALDLYFRAGMGQFEEIADTWMERSVSDGSYSAFREEIRKIAPILTKLPMHAYVGITSPELPDRFKIACDVHDVIRHFLSWEEFPDGGYTVNFNKPFHHSMEPLPKFRREE